MPWPTQFMIDTYRQVTVLFGQTADARQVTVLLGQTADASQQGTNESSATITARNWPKQATVTEGANEDLLWKRHWPKQATTAGTGVASNTVTKTADETAENSATVIGGTVGFGIGSTKQTAGTHIRLVALGEDAKKDKAFCPTVLRKPQGQQLASQHKQNQNT